MIPLRTMCKVLVVCWPAMTLIVSSASAQLSLAIDSGMELEWATSSGQVYQVQWSRDAGPDASWNDLGPAVTGDGGPQRLLDPAHSAGSYRVLAISRGEEVPSNALANGGFEAGDGAVAAGWTATGGIASRSDADRHEGAFSMHAKITNVGSTPGSGLLVQRVEPAGGTVTAGGVYSFSFWARQISYGPSYVQYYQVEWLNASGGLTNSTGYQGFRGGDASWQKIASEELTAPEGTVDARVTFYFATGSVAGGHGEVFLDDLALETSSPNASTVSESSSSQEVSSQRVVIIQWPTSAGVWYQPQSTTDLASGEWTDLAPVLGDGTIREVHAPLTGTARFFRVRYSAAAVEPATNVRAIPTGIAGTVALAWDASSSPGVTGYRVDYGVAGDQLTESIDVGNVTSSQLPGLFPGQTYYFSVVALTAGEESSVATGAIAIRAEGGFELTPLFNVSTVLEPDTVVETPTALITYLADRARDRHAREDIVGGVIFRKYDHYLTWYWEQRVANIEIVDSIAKGGSTITFNYTTQAALNPAEFRAFFSVDSPLSGYHHNAQANLISTHPSIRYPGETDYDYTATLRTKQPEGRALRIGDRVEIEISQFLLGSTLRNGRENYYGTAFLYVVGEGVVPWYAKVREEIVDPAARAGASFDSYPLPEKAWLGGRTTLPYQYSNEPQHRFKQTAGNISPESGHEFMLGRRLHHTDFRTGAHTEPGNPGLAQHAGKVGPKFVGQSCVSCHVNNGRALPPNVGETLVASVVKVGSDASGTPHPILGEELQSFAIGDFAEGPAVLAGYSQIDGTYGDGTAYTLRKPVYRFEGVTPAFFSVRLAPPLVGLGLLEAVPESAIQELADPNDENGDGISGRLAVIDDPESEFVRRLGRFGYKGSQARVANQIAYALNRDMGVTTEIFPILDGEVSPRPAEIDATELAQMNRYVSVLGVGAQRNLTDPAVVRGEALFRSASCVSCHTPSLPTSSYHPMAELRNQTIRPFTDLLLHDMGPGLADGMGEEGATGAEWRTAPLWNIGLNAGVSGGEAYLHDGRARTLEEAILWHGGEAEASREAFRTLPANDREAIVKFLKSL